MALAALLLVGAVYWPVVHGGFVWDDEIDFVKYDWLTAGDAWKHYIFRDFHGWTHYFRPVVVALFTLQLRTFGIEPGPMHAVSLVIHLANTLLVGVLAMRHATTRHSGTKAWLVASACMLLFGLHPSQIETVAWIAAQFDLFATFFMLTGLLAALHFQERRLRAAAVAVSFFLAMCSKESAAAFPVVLVLCDWARQSTTAGTEGWRAFLRRNSLTYAAVVVAGLVYLGFRQWALGPVGVTEMDGGQTVLARLQTAGFLYFRYVLVLVMPGLSPGPLHPYDPDTFSRVVPQYLAMLLAAAGIAAVSAWRALRSRSVAACIVLATGATLLPVLRLVAHTTDNELYALRYLMGCLAVLCVMVPLLSWRLPLRIASAAMLRPAFALLALVWIANAAFSIRTTIPMWSNSVALWSWALHLDPASPRAANALLVAYRDRDATAHARALADRIIDAGIRCENCMITAAEMAWEDRDRARFVRALREARALEPAIRQNYYFRQRYQALIEKSRLAGIEPRSIAQPHPVPDG